MLFFIRVRTHLNSDSDDGRSLLGNKSIRFNDELEKLSGKCVHVDSKCQFIVTDGLD